MRFLPALAVCLAPSLLFGQPGVRPATPANLTTRQFGDLAAGPYRSLVISNVMVIPGHGGPPAGPYDVTIEGNTIAQMVPRDPVSAQRQQAQPRTGDRVIDGTGKYLMPGMIDLHTHLRTLPEELEYVYYLKLAMGVTTMVNAADRGFDAAMVEARKSEANEIIAPRMYPLTGYGTGVTGFTRVQLDDPANAPAVVKQMAGRGLRVISMDPLGWSLELVTAIAKAAKENGMITSFHLQPSNTAVTQAVRAACAGVTMIEHHYGYAESALDNKTQDFTRNYNFGNENDRFREAGKVWTYTNRDRLLSEVADSLVKCGVTMLPTRVVYEANRDFLRAMSLPWHEKYTHAALWKWNLPDPAWHGAFHYDWTSDDEYYWTAAFRLWGDLIYEFNKRGGTVAFGTDDNYIWATPGFSSVRELQLLRETGIHSLEVLKSATWNSAKTLGVPSLGLVRPGYKADLLLVDGNPAANLKFLYSFGDLTLDREGKMHRTQGIVHTIKDGVVMNNARLMEEVEKMVAKSKINAPATDAVRAPFLIGQPRAPSVPPGAR
jgi:cytosine/adenosine deaminase-related metal-dependent hydrolase